MHTAVDAILEERIRALEIQVKLAQEQSLRHLQQHRVTLAALQEERDQSTARVREYVERIKAVDGVVLALVEKLRAVEPVPLAPVDAPTQCTTTADP